MKKLNQTGITHPVLVIVIALVLTGIGYGGWRVYDQNKKDDTKTTTSSSSNTSSKDKTSSDDVAKYFEIKEWGVKIPLASVPEGLSYAIGTKTTSFRSKALNDVSGTCETNSIVVARGKAAEIPPNETNSTEQNFAQYYDNIKNSDDSVDVTTTRDYHTKIGEYYYVPPGFAGASCVSSGSSADLSKETAAGLAIAKSINAMVSAQ